MAHPSQRGFGAARSSAWLWACWVVGGLVFGCFGFAYLGWDGLLAAALAFSVATVVFAVTFLVRRLWTRRFLFPLVDRVIELRSSVGSQGQSVDQPLESPELRIALLRFAYSGASVFLLSIGARTLVFFIGLTIAGMLASAADAPGFVKLVPGFLVGGYLGSLLIEIASSVVQEGITPLHTALSSAVDG